MPPCLYSLLFQGELTLWDRALELRLPKQGDNTGGGNNLKPSTFLQVSRFEQMRHDDKIDKLSTKGSWRKYKLGLE